MVIIYTWALFFMNETLLSIAAMSIVGYAIIKDKLTFTTISNERLKALESSVITFFARYPSKLDKFYPFRLYHS